MQLVILAAGFGRRFGGLKQLAPVGPRGEAVMDVTIAGAIAAGFDGAVVIVREEIREQIADHIRATWPADIPVEILCQLPVPGTAMAVLSAAPAITGPFGVVNADDFYGDSALELLATRLGDGGDGKGHVLVGFELARTILTDQPVNRGLCKVAADGSLVAIVEHSVTLRGDGRFNARVIGRSGPAAGPARILDGKEPTSMNLWGFHPSIFGHLERSAASAVDGGEHQEIFLPTVVDRLVAEGAASVEVAVTDARCVGITHREDASIVHDHLALEAM